ncbi:TIGR04086 family membrane protein [Proteiniborus sp. MB09-C3]|uniref:TIGR04086 family membrane protein n=1 Tax=Proteiniborus sp. MB09-C3 TaxID=3050072 RepID=UPI0025536292|nr:TIGR04086 family membrane protein [Proteiniborus sp. MB09-C3]WIV10753.1 TIGR04086 family membrane protein [Proteiniborus sp. MB09-C3]
MSYFKNQNSSSYFIDVIRGTIIGLMLTILLILIFTITLTYTKLSEELIPLINSIIMILGITSGAIFTSRKLERKGWLSGGLIGILYFIIIFFISALFVKSFAMDKYLLIKGLLAIITGCIGGMIGINIK